MKLLCVCVRACLSLCVYVCVSVRVFAFVRACMCVIFRAGGEAGGRRKAGTWRGQAVTRHFDTAQRMYTRVGEATPVTPRNPPPHKQEARALAAPCARACEPGRGSRARGPNKLLGLAPPASEGCGQGGEMRERKLEGYQAGTEEPPLCTTTHVYCSAPGAGDTRPRHHPATAMHEATPPRRRRAAEPERTLRRSSICPAPPALHAAAQRVRQVASRFFITRAVSAQPLVPPCVRPCSAPRGPGAHRRTGTAPRLPHARHLLPPHLHEDCGSHEEP